MNPGRMLAILCLVALFIAGTPKVSQAVRAPTADALTLLTTIETGGRPDALTIDTCHSPWQVLFYNRQVGQVRFLDAGSLTIAPTMLNLLDDNNDHWMAYDRALCLAYFATIKDRWPFGGAHWEEVLIHVIDNRKITATFSVNESLNSGTTSPPDTEYAIDGMGFKGAGTDGSDPPRIVLDNAPMGRVDVVDLDATGKQAASVQRFSYRDPVTGPSWNNNLGNSLALEPSHETLSPDDLATNDLLYISDNNRAFTDGYGYIRVYKLNHAGFSLGAVPLPEVNLNATWPFVNGFEGLGLAGPRDRLYVASAKQSFENGYMGRVDTTNRTDFQATTLLYNDLGQVLVDWYDTNRVFILTYDGFDYDPDDGLYLHLVYDSTVVDSLRLKTGYDPFTSLNVSMAFDPYLRRFYLGIGSEILVVQVDYGLGALPTPCVGCAYLYLPVARK